MASEVFAMLDDIAAWKAPAAVADRARITSVDFIFR